MKLRSIKRSTEKKSEAKRLRRQGYIPAIVYGSGNTGANIAVEATEFDTRLRHLPPGRLSTTVFTLTDDEGNQKRAILKDIQYDIVNYNVINLDFEELHDNQPVNVKVPIECSGVADCAGVKLGGVLRQVIRHLKVRCLPENIPTNFNLDVTSLGMKQSRRLKDIELPQTLRPLSNLNEVAVIVAKR